MEVVVNSPLRIQTYEAYDFPKCAVCESRLHDSHLKYVVRIVHKRRIYVPMKENLLACLYCDEKYETIELFSSEKDALRFGQDLYKRAGLLRPGETICVPVIEFDSRGRSIPNTKQLQIVLTPPVSVARLYIVH